MNQSIDNGIEGVSSVISRDDRKKLRRDRITNKCAEAETGLRDKSSSTERVPAAKSNGPLHVSYGHGQIIDSQKLIEAMKSEALLNVTQLRIEAERRETLRRQNNKLRENSNSFDADKKDCGLHNIIRSNPQEPKDLDTCRERLDEISAQKENQADELRRALRKREEAYVNEVKNQRSDIVALRELIKAETGKMEDLYTKERDKIEFALLHDRDDIIRKHRKDMDALFDKKEKMEVYHDESRNKREIEYEKKLNDLREEKKREYNELKVNFDADIERLEHELGDLHSSNRVFCDKLHYELQTLLENDKNNSEFSQKYKRKLAKGEEELNRVKEQYRLFHESKEKQKCVDLNDVSRAANRLKELQAKVKHLKKFEKQKHDSIWDMHKEEVFLARDDVLSKHRTITTEILGWSWNPGQDTETLLNQDTSIDEHTPHNYDYWKNVSSSVSRDTCDEWDQLESALTEYRDVLLRRERILANISDLSHEVLRIEGILSDK
uniref:Dynein regulatory complex protein 1 C-terminal domain-containing protein n=1 Tax=Leptocylindrus danicus TaxID=163516 RepID=A0A7S2JYW6_9STRA|mmetsp:Transcript_13643/g.20276  ORF Transcript_13643/g.20276 Transcript_13643/m.20276 type:complete len:495 (+) Transcript_13643:155-1639(+)|eukprot:CAMPEP_0116020168 /NCGR_PEP_ID=MMETSP0321-20121206/9646_1 /TAXON_ID=163516 /ORGANISM="Leptocylindrus danicus var. danicus, Strain B650" /LENGTH=494 /DNA_ID=CAMNT_0003490827 /DNA_START=145 /DNA_END=1629 /DNA_ORIENTATION=-